MKIIEIKTESSGIPLKVWEAVNSAIFNLIVMQIEISDSGSKGGYLSKFRVSGFDPIYQGSICVGNFDKSKNLRYFALSIEKATRLHSKYLQLGHLTSRYSSDDNNEEFAGAIIYEVYKNILKEKCIYSFSGLKPEFDEFLSVIASCVDDYHLLKNTINHVRENYMIKIYSERESLINAPDELKLRMKNVACAILHD